MKSYYIYLAKFKNSFNEEYWYIGSHSWKGPVGQIDESYATSSYIAKQYRWRWVSMEILEVLPDGKNIRQRECYWINKYAEEYGIADIAYSRGKLHGGNIWIEKWRRGGKMINCHDNSCEHATYVSQKKMLSGDISVQQRKNFQSLKQRILPLVAMAHTPESLQKAVAARDYHEIHRKRKETMRKFRTLYEIDGVFIGDFEDVAKYLGCAISNASKWLRGYQPLPKRCGTHEFKIVDNG